MGHPLVPNAVSLSHTIATDIGASVIGMIHCFSELFSKSKNLLLNHNSLKEKKINRDFSIDQL